MGSYWYCGLLLLLLLLPDARRRKSQKPRPARRATHATAPRITPASPPVDNGALSVSELPESTPEPEVDDGFESGRPGAEVALELAVELDTVVVLASTPASGNALRQTHIGSSSSLNPANCVVSKP